MLIYHHTKEKKWLEQVAALYPQGDMAEEAGKLLEQLAAKAPALEDGVLIGAYESVAGMRYEKLRLEDERLPPSVRGWVEENSGKPYRGTMTGRRLGVCACNGG